MIGLGILVLVIVGLASLAVVLRGGYPVRIDVHWFTVKTSVGVVFLAGAVALALVVFGLSLLYEGVKRGHRRRKETKDLRKRVQASESSAPVAPGGAPASSTNPPPAPPTPGGSSQVTRPARGPDEHFDTAPRES
jgi:hypothetical protein